MAYINTESFNARYLSFEQVAESFIPNNEFLELLENTHSIVMGPRGCGKTTLLKMLTPMALDECKKTQHLISQIPFYGIYIPADKHWDSQLQHMETLFGKESKNPELISKVLVSINTLTSTIKCFRYLIKRYGDKDFQNETRLSTELVNILNLNKPISPTLYSILHALSKIVDDINLKVKKIYYKAETDIADFTEYLLYEDFLPLVKNLCTAFEEIYKDHSKDISGFKWALCFDELEIAPKWLQNRLFVDCLRSTDQRFLFKITSTPVIDWKDTIENNNDKTIPSDKNDYNIIRTWVYNQETKNRWNIFCEELFTEIIKRKKGLEHINLSDIFGSNDYIEAIKITDKQFFTSKDIEKRDFEKDSDVMKMYKLLAKRDESFAAFLKQNDISISRYNQKQIEKKKDLLRKIKPTVAFRYYLLGRTRKENHLYHGLPFVFELTDGNPRVAINLMNEFITKLVVKADGEIERLSIQAQASIINEFSKLRLDYYKGYPNACYSEGNKTVSMGELLEMVGSYFKQDLLSQNFIAEPVTCFSIDKNTKTLYAQIVELALNEGAIQDITPNESRLDSDSRRFRLSFILHPYFGLPKRVNKSILLNDITSTNKANRPKRKVKPDNSGQITIKFNS